MSCDTPSPRGNEAGDDQLILFVGHLLFGEDVTSIHQALFFGRDEESVTDAYITRHRGSSAWLHIKEQFSSGWQPGAAVSGHARTRLMQHLISGLDATALDSINKAFKAYDSCKMSLLSLVHVLVQWTSSRTLSHAILHALPAYISREKLLSPSSTDDAAHADAMDPCVHTAGHFTSRGALMCCNCGTTSTSVWRVANAGLKSCNACGTYFAKHSMHRPEHLVAACKARNAEREAAAAAKPSGSIGSAGSLQGMAFCSAPTFNTHAAVAACKPTMRACITSDDSDSAEQPRASKRQRKASMRLASEDFIMHDSFTSSKHFGFETAPYSCDGSDGDDSSGEMGRRQSSGPTFEKAVEALVALKHAKVAVQSSTDHSMLRYSSNIQQYGEQQPQHQVMLSAEQYALPATLFTGLRAGISTAGSSAAAAEDDSAAAATDRAEASTSQADTAAVFSEAQRIAGVWTSVMGQSNLQEDSAPAAATQVVVQGSSCQQLPYGVQGVGSSLADAASGDLLQWYGSRGSSGSELGSWEVGCNAGSGDSASGEGGWEADLLQQLQDSDDNSIRIWDLSGSGSGTRPQGHQLAGGRGALSRFGAEYQAAHVLPASTKYPNASAHAVSPSRHMRGGQHKCCANCSSQQTPAWRRDKEDHSRLLCNPCGIYKNTNGVDRPLSGKAPARRQTSGKQLKGRLSKPDAPQPMLPAEQQEPQALVKMPLAEMQSVHHQQWLLLQQGLRGTSTAAAPAAVPFPEATRGVDAGLGQQQQQHQQDSAPSTSSAQRLPQQDMVCNPMDYRPDTYSRSTKQAEAELQGLPAATLRDYGRSSSCISSQDLQVVLLRTSSAANNVAGAAARPSIATTGAAL